MPLTINGERVEEAEIQREADMLLQRFRQLSPEERQANGFDDDTMREKASEWARENVIERTLLRQQARQDTEPIPADMFEKALEQAKKRFGGDDKLHNAYSDEFIHQEVKMTIRLDRLIGRVTGRVKPPKTREVADYYRKHKDQFREPERIRAAHIVKHVNEQVSEDEARRAIDEIKARLDAGEPFETLANELSDCPGNGGDLGYFPRGQMVPEFEEVVFEMQPGQISGVFQSVFGFHIAKALDRQPARVKPMSEVQDQIKNALTADKRNRLLEDYVDSLREEAEIEDIAPACIENLVKA